MSHVLRLPRRRAALAAAIVVALVAVLPASALALPSRISALGDSITRAFNTQFDPTCNLFFTQGLLDCPRNSWSTGTGTAVNSLLRRVDAANGPAGVVGFNDARSGARVNEL